MNGSWALWFALWPLAGAGVYAMVITSHESHRYRISPVMLVGTLGWLLMLRWMSLEGDGVTDAQIPFKDYLLASTAFWSACTVIGLCRLTRKHRGCR